jgi:glycosyltransferase involved in cell wall biosynthesis
MDISNEKFRTSGSDTDMEVSVIMSTYNRADFLPDAFAALAAQDCRPRFEVIVIDNASTDETPAIIGEWCRKDARFRTARESRLGLSWGKNAGIRLARAPLLLFTDDDMLVDPRWIRSYCELFSRRKNGIMLAGGPCVPIPHDLGKWPAWFDEPALADVALLQYHQERVLNRMEWVWGGNMAVPAQLFDQFGPWDVTVGRKGQERGTFEDTEFQDRIRNAGGTVWFCPDAVVHHRVPREAVTPRRVSATAFSRGRNAVWMQNLPIWHDVNRVPRRNPVIGFLALVGNLLWWGIWAIAFRLLRNKSCFEHARRAAFASGRSLDSLRAGRDSIRLFQAAGHIVFPALNLFLRLIPDVD